MAVLKHIASKNADYSQIIDYMLFQHDEFTMKPILDENGRMILREEYYIDGISCEPMLFDKECEKLNAQYHKNQHYADIKSHHYILSFDPKDKDDHGLTGEQAQALGIEYAKKNFPGHQALVCTHMDGHNGSGNIHVHIIINSLRKLDVEQQPFMERPCDSRAGYKHHLTNDYLKHLQQSVMDMCHRENLYQVDLLSPSKNKITQKEYWAARRGQENLDKRNEQIIADGMKPRRTTFQTQKQFLRDAIKDIASQSKNLEDFKNGLREKYHITLTDRRGRFSYLHPDRDRNITDRALGTHYYKDYLMELFEQNQNRFEETPDISETEHLPGPPANPQEKKHSFFEYNPDYDYSTDPVAILFIKSDLRLVVDLQNNVKAQQSHAYAQKVKISNLQQMAKTIAYVQEHHYDTSENLQMTFNDISEKCKEARKAVKATETCLKNLNQQIHYTGQYLTNKPVFAQMLKSRNKKKFRQEHQTEIELYEAAVKFLKEENADGKIPSMKSLKEKKEKLTIQRSAQYDTYHYFKEYQKELRTVCSNVDSILGQPHIPETYRSQDHTIS
ncbi:relaxase/mobilization nuclease domain-containing protein [Ruminococcus sp. 5_1_39BFAA]|uniref:relaxase/mobilization nuclease domain-containing protein n=1 Tax=Ruminococcus sp. 5_1_39BFAA TaxID=457412 RepID=UPI00356A6508